MRKIIREELNEAGIKGQTFYKDPVTGEWTAGMSDVEGPGAEMAMKMREPKITGVGRVNPNKAVEIQAMSDLHKLIDEELMGGYDLEVVLPKAIKLINAAAAKIREPRARQQLKDDLMDMLDYAMKDEGLGEDEDEYDIMNDPDADPVDVADLPGGEAMAWHMKHRETIEPD